MWGWASVRVAMAALIMTTGGATPAAAGPPPDTHESSLEVVADAASDDARLVMRWIAQTHDALGTPFAVVDKRNARIFVFTRAGRLAGTAPALLGQAPGDASAPGIGDIAPQDIPPELRTTPAGRFASVPGRNLAGEAVVWVDYTTAIAIHRLRPAPASERRPQRLASATTQDNRISLGCIVVDGAFYDAVVAPLLGRERGVVYVLPEHTDTASWLAAHAAVH